MTANTAEPKRLEKTGTGTAAWKAWGRYARASATAAGGVASS